MVVGAAFIRGTIVFTVVFVLAMTILIWYRWYPVPSATIQFVGDESVDGAIATVSRAGLEICSVTLDKTNDFHAAAWLVPGTYDLVISLDGRVVQRTPIVASESRTLVDTFTLNPEHARSRVPPTSPSIRPTTLSD